MKRTLKLTIEYVGTNFHGWQVQPGFRTIQEELEKAFKVILGSPVIVNSAGRTDAGVHALNQTASIKTDSTMPLERMRYAVNSLLPHDVKIKDVKEMPSSFHARWSALSRSYEYRIINCPYPPVFEHMRAFYYRMPLRLDLMEQALSLLVGTHDFSAFCSKSKPLKHYSRTIHEACITKHEGEIRISIKANAFLHNMVRIIVGTLIEVGLEKIAVGDIASIIESGERSMAGYTAPAHGLYLVDVEYPPEYQ